MSVMVISEKEYTQLYNFLCEEESKNLDEQKVSDKLGEKKTEALRNIFENRHSGTIYHLHALNVLNYCIKYGEDFVIDHIDLRMPVEPIDKKEAINIVRSIRYNICDNFDTDDADYLIQYIENNL